MFAVLVSLFTFVPSIDMLMIQQLHTNPLHRDFFNLKKIFQSDEMFQKLMMAMAEHRQYFSDLKVVDAVEEVRWWLYHTNISCTQSGLVSEEDVNAFALFIIMDFTYWTMAKEKRE